MNQSQFQTITCNSLKAREKSRVHGAIGFGFDSHWCESFKPITKRSNRNHVITFDSHLKTTLIMIMIIIIIVVAEKESNGAINVDVASPWDRRV